MEDNSALQAAIRERLILELTKLNVANANAPHAATTTRTITASKGVITDDCEKENKIVREGILLELTKSKETACRDVKDASIQTEKEERRTKNNNHPDYYTIEQRLIEAEREFEQRMRREMNAKLRLSAKKQAIEAMSRLERKHKDECRLLRKQLSDERKRAKQHQDELLQVISQQKFSSQKDQKELEQKIERERLERAALESGMGLVYDKMKQFQIQCGLDAEKLTQSKVEKEQRKRQFHIELSRVEMERDKYKLISKDLEKTKEETQKKLEKAVSNFEAKVDEVTALRALLKQCQSSLEMVSFNDEKCTADKYNIEALATAHTQALPVSIIDKGTLHQHAGIKPSLEDPPSHTLKDPPEEVLPFVQSLVTEALAPKEVKQQLLDFHSSHDISSRAESERVPLPMNEEQLKGADTSHPIVAESVNESHRLIQAPNEPEVEEPVSLLHDEGKLLSANSDDNSIDSESSYTDEYSMGSFCSVEDRKLESTAGFSFSSSRNHD